MIIIKEILWALDLKQIDAARRVGISKTSLRDYMTDVRPIPSDVAYSLVMLLPVVGTDRGDEVRLDATDVPGHDIDRLDRLKEMVRRFLAEYTEERKRRKAAARYMLVRIDPADVDPLHAQFVDKLDMGFVRDVRQAASMPLKAANERQKEWPGVMIVDAAIATREAGGNGKVRRFDLGLKLMQKEK